MSHEERARILARIAKAERRIERAAARNEVTNEPERIKRLRALLEAEGR
jgi:hypothetical protein